MPHPRTDPSDTPGALAEGRFEIVNELGMHARAAARLVELAARFDAEVVLEKDGQCANAKSIMGVLLLCGQKGSFVRVSATGAQRDAAVDAIGRLIADRFGEER